MPAKNRKQIAFLAHKEDVPSHTLSIFKHATDRYEHVHNQTVKAIKEQILKGSGDASLQMFEIYISELNHLLFSVNMVKDIISTNPESFNMEVEEPKPKKKASKKKVSEDTLLSKINKSGKEKKGE